MMTDQPPTPPDEPESAMGDEPEETSGAGYGNHAPAAAEGPAEETSDGK